MTSDNRITIGTKKTIESEVLGDSREIMIATPSEYDAEASYRYPVIYVLDGPGHFHYLSGLVNALARNGRMPHMLVVAVDNTDRTRDMTPLSQKQSEIDANPTHGGANNFIEFFETELIPWIDSQYRTEAYRMLIGHSFGGLFAIYTLINRPELFGSYLAISPSLWWNNQALVNQAGKFFAGKTKLARDLYMTMGDEGGAMLGGARKLAGILDEHAPRDFCWDFCWLNDETHGTIPMRSTLQGLEFIFKAWTIPELLPLYDKGGIAALGGYATEVSARYGFERKLSGSIFQRLVLALFGSDRHDDVFNVISHDPDTYLAPPELLDHLATQSLEQGKAEVAGNYLLKLFEYSPGNPTVRERLSKLDVEIPQMKEVVLSAQQLSSLTGTYRFPTGIEVTISLTEGKLFSFAAGTGKPKSVLTPMSSESFYIPGSDAQLRFIVDEADTVSRLVYSDGMNVSKAIRMPG